MRAQGEGCQEPVLLAALRVARSRLSTEEYAHSANEAEYAAEQLALAARELVRATDALPENEQPVGWTNTVREPRTVFRRSVLDEPQEECDQARAAVAEVSEQLKTFFAGVLEAHTALVQAAYGPNPSDPAEALRKAISDLVGPLSDVAVERTP